MDVRKVDEDIVLVPYYLEEDGWRNVSIAKNLKVCKENI